jgi:hypothetical protein
MTASPSNFDDEDHLPVTEVYELLRELLSDPVCETICRF